MKNEILEKAYNGSYYTIIGCGGDLNDWKNGYHEMLEKEEIGKIKEWVEFTGEDINKYYNVIECDKFKNDLHFLAFNLDGLNIGKLAMFKLRMGDRWFDDIVNNLKKESEVR